jgi:hypothetical protein
MRDERRRILSFCQDSVSEHYQQQYLSSPMDPERERILTELASESRRRQHILEQAEQPPFDEFLAHYLERL